MHFVCSLKTQLKHLFSSASLDRASVFLNKLQVDSGLGCLLINQLNVFEAELTAGLGDTNFNKLSGK